MVHLHRKIWVVVELSHFKLLTTLKSVFIVLEIIVIQNGAKCKPHAKQNHAPVMFLSDFMFMSIQKLMQDVQHITIASKKNIIHCYALDIWIAIESTVPS